MAAWLNIPNTERLLHRQHLRRLLLCTFRNWMPPVMKVASLSRRLERFPMQPCEFTCGQTSSESRDDSSGLHEIKYSSRSCNGRSRFRRSFVDIGQVECQQSARPRCSANLARSPTHRESRRRVHHQDPTICVTMYGAERFPRHHRARVAREVAPHTDTPRFTL